MGEIGSIKNRIKQWRKNWKRMKEEKERQRQKQIQKEEKEFQKKSRLKVTLLTMTGLFFALLETILKPSKVEKKIPVKKQVVSPLEELVTEVKEIKTALQKIEEKQKKISTKEEHKIVKEEVLSLNKTFQALSKKKEMVKNEVILPMTTQDQRGPKKQTMEDKKPKVKMRQEKKLVEEYHKIKQEFSNIQSEFEVIEETLNQKEVMLEEEQKKEVPTFEKQSFPFVNKEEKKDEMGTKKKLVLQENRNVPTQEKELKAFLKMLNHDYQKLNQELEEILKNRTDNKEVYGKLSVLSHKIYYYSTIERDMKKKIPFENYKNNHELAKLDKYQFLTKLSVFGDLLESCERTKWDFDEKTKEQEDEKKEITKDHQEKIQTIKVDHEELIKKLKKQQLHLESLEQNLKKLHPGQQKKGKLSLLTSFLKNGTFVSLGIFTGLAFLSPASILTGLILTNHGIRGMRKFGNQDKKNKDYWDLKKILGQIKEEKDLLNFSYDICNDSIAQIQALKQEVILEYGNIENEMVMDFYNQLFEIELSLLAQKREIENRRLQLQEEYVLGKEKVKRIEERM